MLFEPLHESGAGKSRHFSIGRQTDELFHNLANGRGVQGKVGQRGGGATQSGCFIGAHHDFIWQGLPVFFGITMLYFGNDVGHIDYGRANLLAQAAGNAQGRKNSGGFKAVNAGCPADSHRAGIDVAECASADDTGGGADVYTCTAAYAIQGLPIIRVCAHFSAAVVQNDDMTLPVRLSRSLPERGATVHPGDVGCRELA